MNRLTLLILLVSAASIPAQLTKEQRVTNWLRNQDKDTDGKISRAEAVGRMKNVFARNDANSDGFLDKSELEELAARIQGNSANRNNARRGVMTTKQLIARAGKDLVVEANIRYRKGESAGWRLDLVRPKERSQLRRAAIVFVHGGGWRNGDKRRGYFIQGAIDYARKGYVCISVNYRLVGEAPFPACIQDVKCAIRWLRANSEKYNVDPTRIGAYGNSAGAHLVSLAGLAGKGTGLEGDGPYRDHSSALQAVCASATPTDFLLNPRWMNRFSGTRGGLFKGSKEDIEKLAKMASPVRHVRAAAPPFFIVHGTGDKVVDVAHGDTFVEALKKIGAADVTYLRVEGAGHGVFGQHRKKTHPAMERFFDRTIGQGSLKKKKTKPQGSVPPRMRVREDTRPETSSRNDDIFVPS